MPLTELTIDELIPQNEYYIESNAGNILIKYKATFSHIQGIQCAIFVNPFELTPTGFTPSAPSAFLRMPPRWAKYFHKIGDTIRRKVENQNDFICEAAFQKVMRDVFCPATHYNENDQTLYDENGMILNYKDSFVNMHKAKQRKIK